MNGPRRVRCRRCQSSRDDLVFFQPTRIYCANCERQVGETTDPVVANRATLNVSESTVVDPDTGEHYADVEWNRDRVAIL